MIARPRPASLEKRKEPVPNDLDSLLREENRALSELKETLRIDRDNLDECWVENPVVFHRVAEASALAISRRDEAKLNWDQEIARADARVRHDLAVSEGKFTEGEVRQQVALDKEVVGTANEFYAWKGIADRWSALLDAYSQRSRALKSLSELYVAGYWGSVSGGRARTDARDRLAEEAREGMNSRRAARAE